MDSENVPAYTHLKRGLSLGSRSGPGEKPERGRSVENKALERQKKPLVGDNCRSGPVGDGSTIVRAWSYTVVVGIG